MCGLRLRSVSLAVLAGVISGGAFAADLGGSVKDYGYPAEPTFSWTGVDLGGQMGYAFDGRGDYEHKNFNTFGGPGGLYDMELAGVFGGGHLGANYQLGSIVFGIEGTYSAGDVKGNTNFAMYANDTTTSIDNLWTATAKLGFTSGRTLVYAKAGFAGADVTAGQNYYALPPATPAKWSAKESATGWTAGMGISHALTNSLVAGLELNHYDLGNFSFSGKDSGGTLTKIDGDFSFTAIEGRLSYKFW